MPKRHGPEAWRYRYAHPCAWAQDFPPLSVTEMFADSAARFGGRVLTDFLEREFTYGAIYAEARRFAAGLQQMGIVKGDRVGLYLSSVPAYLSAYFGALMAGAAVVSLSVATDEELLARVTETGIRVLVTIDGAEYLNSAEYVLKNSNLERLVVVRFASQLPFWLGVRLRLFDRVDLSPLPARPDVVEWSDALSDVPLVPVRIDPITDIALLQYAAEPGAAARYAMLSHQNLTANARQIAAIEPHAHLHYVMMGILPLHDIAAVTQVLNRPVLGGGTIALLPRFSAGRVLATIERTRVTTMAAQPAMFEAMLAHPAMAKTDLSCLFSCVSVGWPLEPGLKKSFEKATGAKLVEGYGVAEAAGGAATNPLDGREQAGSIGHPLPGTDMRLIDQDDPSRDARVGEVGELAICGPQVMLGYWNTGSGEQPFIERDGQRWVRMGRMAAIDEDGYVSLVDGQGRAERVG